jgi:lysophospholipase L1-like esterase
MTVRTILRLVQPSTVVIREGINDLRGGRSALDIVGNLGQMAESVRASGARPVILTVLPVDRTVFPDAESKVEALNAAIRTMAKQQHLQVIDAAARFLGHRPLSVLFRHADGREDGVHPNDAGYRLLAYLHPFDNRHSCSSVVVDVPVEVLTDASTGNGTHQHDEEYGDEDQHACG